MKLRRIVAALAVLSSLALVAPAAHASQVCYDINVTANGQTLVDEAGCQDLP